jgi:hypothetical protein
MSKRVTNLITLAVIVIAAFFGYKYFFVTPDTSETPGVSVVATDGSTSNSSEFLNLLLSVKNLTLSKAIFDNPVFRDRLKDFGRELPDREVGRDNPFAPFGVGGNGVLVSGSGSLKATSTNNVKATTTPAVKTSTTTAKTTTKATATTTKPKTTTNSVDLKSLEADLNQVDNLDSGADFTF